MLARIPPLLRQVDPCFILSVVILAIIIPVGFSIDHLKLETSCTTGPVLYLGDYLITPRVPLPFRWFLGNSTTVVRLIISSYNASSESEAIARYYSVLKVASDRGVSIDLITNTPSIYDNFTFCKTRTLLTASGGMFVFLAESDGRRVIYSSGLLAEANCPEGQFFVDFANCKSLANDVRALFDMLVNYGKSGDYPSIFLKKFIPNGSFPQRHSLPGGGSCVLGISPEELAPPGRFPVVNWVDDHFVDFGDNLSLLSQALFPRASKAGVDMPELLLTERIENATLHGTNVRILIPTREWSRSEQEVRSLLQFPNVDVKVTNSTTRGRCRLPTLYTFRDVTGFMPMPFEYIVDSSAITFSLHITDASIAERLLAHFNQLWEDTAVALDWTSPLRHDPGLS
jgi:hypothetical protein